MSTIVLPYQIVRVISGTTSVTIGTQTTHAHSQGKVPLFYTLKSRSNGVVYEGAVADATNIYVKGGAASLNFDAIIVFMAL